MPLQIFNGELFNIDPSVGRSDYEALGLAKNIYLSQSEEYKKVINLRNLKTIIVLNFSSQQFRGIKNFMKS